MQAVEHMDLSPLCEEEALFEDAAHERAFWENPLQNVEREAVGLKMMLARCYCI